VKREVKFSVYLIFPHTFFTRSVLRNRENEAQEQEKEKHIQNRRKRLDFILYNKKFISEVRKIEEKSSRKFKGEKKKRKARAGS
jgi:hypothetical protein